MSPSTSIYPGLFYVDAEAAMDWLERTLGLGRHEVHHDDEGNVVAIDDVDALHRRATDAGAEIALELTDTDYGSRDFTVRDPEGNLWAFGTYRPSAGSIG